MVTCDPTEVATIRLLYMNHLLIPKTYGWQHHEFKTLNHNFLLKKGLGMVIEKKLRSLIFFYWHW